MDAITSVLDAALGFMDQILWAGFTRIAAFLLDYFPDADPVINGYIDGFGGVLTGQGLTFNVMYFVDMTIIGTVFGMMVVVIAASYITMMIRAVIDMVTKLMDSIPIIG